MIFNISNNKLNYSDLLKLLNPQNIKNNSQDIIHWEHFKDFYNILYVYPNYLGYGIGFNYFETLKQTGRKTLSEKIIEGLFNQQIISILADIIINQIISFDNINLSNQDNSDEKIINFNNQCLSIFLDNWMVEQLDINKFFNDINIIQTIYNQQDYIYFYYSIVENNLSILENIYQQILKGQHLDTFKHKCIFFNIIQLLFNGNMDPLMYFKVTYPSRVNYPYIKKYFYTNNLYKPYNYGHRYVLTEIYQKQSIGSLNLKSILIDQLKLDINNPDWKKNLIENFSNINNNLQAIIILYFFITKINNSQSIKKYQQYIYWLLCRYYSSYFHELWIENLKKQQQGQ
jgi:hypothetical protein